MKGHLTDSVIRRKLFVTSIILLVLTVLIKVSQSAEDGSSKTHPKKGIVIKVPGTMATSASNLRPKIQKIGRPRQFWSDQLQIESQQTNRNYAAYPPGFAKGSANGFGFTTLLAVSAVSAFLGAMTYSAFDRGQGNTGRSATESMFSLLNLIDPDAVMKVLSSTDWADDLTSSSGNSSNPIMRRGRIVREPKADSSSGGPLMKWYQAYRKDPVEMRCVHKLICENLATTSCAAKTINPDFDGTILSLLKYAMGSVGISELITETVGNPRLCKEIYIPYDLCTIAEDAEKTTGVAQPEKATSPLPAFNLTSIVPRVKYV